MTADEGMTNKLVSPHANTLVIPAETGTHCHRAIRAHI